FWGEKFQLAGDRNQVGQFMNDRRGQMIATSVGATAMGRGCDTAILDDPVSADQALSDAERTRANNWLDATLRSRLNDPATGAIILVMQRLRVGSYGILAGAGTRSLDPRSNSTRSGGG